MPQAPSSIFKLQVVDLAQEMEGKELELPDGRVVTITQADAFDRASNTKGVYKSMLEMRPGQVFVARVQSAFMFLIVALEGRLSGACVRIKGLDTPEAGEIEGGGRVGKYVGFNEHKQVGRIEERPGKPLRLIMEGVLTPEVPTSNGGSKVKLTDRVLSRYADRLGEYFMGNAKDPSYDAFLTRIKTEWGTEAELKKRLGMA